jgi:hypothetical protein
MSYLLSDATANNTILVTFLVHTRCMNIKNEKLSVLLFILGFASIIASIAFWYVAKEPDLAHGERFGIFVGLWAPTFFILSERFSPKKL